MSPPTPKPSPLVDPCPIQVKQKDKAGRPDIDAFQTAMHRGNRPKGFFVAFDYTQDCHASDGIGLFPRFG